MKHAQHAVLCGAMVPLKLIVRDGSLGNGTIATAAAALSHVIGNSGANVDNEPMWQDGSLLEKLMFVAASEIIPGATLFHTSRHLLQVGSQKPLWTKLRGAARYLPSSPKVLGFERGCSPIPTPPRALLPRCAISP
jgi:hypothetical protein